MSVLDLRNRSVSVAEANAMAARESEGRLSFVEDGLDVIAVYRRSDVGEDADRRHRAIHGDGNLASATAIQRIPMSRLALTAWGVFEMARAAGLRPERMVHGRANRAFATQGVDSLDDRHFHRVS